MLEGLSSLGEQCVVCPHLTRIVSKITKDNPVPAQLIISLKLFLTWIILLHSYSQLYSATV